MFQLRASGFRTELPVILLPERALGTVKKNAEVSAIDFHLSADSILIQIFEEDGRKDLAIPVGQVVEDVAD